MRDVNSDVIPLVEYWLPEEYAAGLCTEKEIGKEKRPLIEARRLAQRATPIAIKALIEVAREADSSGSRVKAANALLDRGWGRPEQPIQASPWAPTPAILEEMPWISPNRLSYKRGAVIAQDILDKASGETVFIAADKPDAATDPLPADTAAEAPDTAAQHANSISAPLERPAEKIAPRASTPAAEKRDVRRDNGPRGNAKHK